MSAVLPDFSLTGKVALITGASRGIGATIAHAYAAAGAKVVLSSRKIEGVEAVATQIRDAGGEALAIAAHTSDEQAIHGLVARASEQFGGVDILVNNAATNPHFGPLLSAESSHWKKTLEVNVQGYFHTIQACVGSMRERGGKVINIASIAGQIPQPGLGLYSVSKAAVLMLTEVLASELAADNIQVNAIAPGYIKTQFSSALWNDPTRYQDLIERIPQRRIAEPHELLGLALYLASAASNYTTGSVFTVDGGQRVGRG
jgi:NAD(P)-dependent dehydrogenase (short-subunit alcohol dehydrogenase family)